MVKRQTFQISFYCREAKKNRQGLSPIEISIIINGQRTYISLQRKERPKEFAAAMKSNRTNPINVYCENQRAKLNDIAEEMQFADIELTASNLKDCYRKGGIAAFHTLGQLFKNLAEEKKVELASGNITSDAYSRYELAQMAFYAANDFNDDTPANAVTIDNIRRFQTYLVGKGLKQSSIHNYQTRVKMVFALAFNSGKIKANPYATFKSPKGDKKEIVWLSGDELKNLTERDFHCERLNNVRDLFLFQCYSGLSYGDMALLSPSDYQKNERGQILIQKKRKKTGEPFSSIVLRGGIDILERHNYILPIISNQRMNAYLKEIQTISGIQKNLHTHLGRRTYICLLYNACIDIQMIADICGHASTATTLKYYARLCPDTKLNAFREKKLSCLNAFPSDTEEITTDDIKLHYELRKEGIL